MKLTKNPKHKTLNRGNALVLLSGGQDSTTVLFWAKEKFGNVETISFDYGQQHRIELKSAKKISVLAGVKNTLIDVKEYDQIKGSSLFSIRNPKSEIRNPGFPNLGFRRRRSL